MKPISLGLFILVLAGQAFGSSMTIAQVKKQLQFAEGPYKIFRGDEDLCGVGVDIAYDGSNASPSVSAGQKFIWGRLGDHTFSEEAGVTCKTTVTNTLGKLRLKSTSRYKCKDPANNFVITLEMVGAKDQVQINYERLEPNKKNNQKYYCVYKK